MASVMVPFDSYLPVVAQFVASGGYVRSGEVDNRGLPKLSTADEAWGYFADLRKQNVKALKISDASEKKAKVALAWGRKVAPTMAQKSDYWHNMYAALTADAVTKRTKGLVASIISAYDRHTEKKAEKVGGGDKGAAEETQAAPTERVCAGY